MTPLIAFILYFVIGGGYSLFRWITFMIQIQAFSKSMEGLFPDSRRGTLMAKVFEVDTGSEELHLPPDAKQFTYKIGRWAMFWPVYIFESAWKVFDGRFSKRG